MLVLSRILVGVILLFFGRRLYWLFVAVIGFVYGLELAPRLLPEQSQTVILLIALGLAVLGAVVAVVGTKIVLGMTGFVAGGGIAMLLFQNVIDSGLVATAVYLVAGVIGAVLFLLLFDTALIVLSSLAGAGLIVASAERLLGISPSAGTVLIIVLTVVGIVVQSRLHRGRRPIKREA